MPFNKVVPPFASEVEARSLDDPNGMSFDIGFDASFSGDYAVTGPTGAIDIFLDQLAFADIDIGATGAAGDVNLDFRADSSGFVDLVAKRIGDVTFTSRGNETSGSAFLRAESGGIGDITIDGRNTSGRTFVDASAFGGDIGNIAVSVLAATSEVDVSAYASGGSIGDVSLVNEAGSGSGEAILSAYAELRPNGTAVGGTIGDITLTNSAASGDLDVDAFAYGITSGGQYAGGGSIGDISLVNTSGASSGEVDVNATAYSGGTIGNISIVNDPGQGGYSASGEVNATVYGVSGQVGTIGDIDVLVRGDLGNNNSGTVFASAYAGNIGDVTMTADAQNAGSGILGVFASAFHSAGIGGGRIGDITMSNNTFAGDNELFLVADRVIGDISVDQTGGGSANTRVTLSGSADVGDIALSFSDDHSGSAGNVFLNMEDGATGGNVGDITVEGGTRVSTFNVGGGSFAESVGIVDFSAFEGSAFINLSGVDEGTTIYASLGGSHIKGTGGSDRIHLDRGGDVVDVTFNSEFDRVFDFQVDGGRKDGLEVVGPGTYEGLLTENPPAPIVVDGGDVYALVEIPGGDDILTPAGLLAALNGGDYSNLDAAANSTATFITAATRRDPTFEVYEAVNTDADTDYDTVQLVALVQADDGVRSLDQGNFFSI